MALRIEDLPVSYDLHLAHYRIGAVELYRFDRESFRPIDSADGSGYCCGLLKITSGNSFGWGAYALLCPQRHFDLVRWANVYMQLKGLSVAEAVHCVRSKGSAWGLERKTLAEAALLDLANDLRRESPLQRKACMLERSALIACSESYFSF
ncbi:hypothetical protein [Paenibacillus sp. MBLB4367]|uniref:hypothetical protein n=1 Tax=Paenibacillus sp. MBLB4367 TaxID=3384767 RepID=UPI00390806FF